MNKKYCENCYWFKTNSNNLESESGECMKEAPKERWRVRGNDFCRDWEDKQFSERKDKGCNIKEIGKVFKTSCYQNECECGKKVQMEFVESVESIEKKGRKMAIGLCECGNIFISEIL